MGMQQMSGIDGVLYVREHNFLSVLVFRVVTRSTDESFSMPHCCSSKQNLPLMRQVSLRPAFQHW